MSNKAHRRSAAEQYELIMECRSSGMSDHQWCVAHDINPGTFYNWVKSIVAQLSRQKSKIFIMN